MEPDRPNEPTRTSLWRSCHSTDRDRRNQRRLIAWGLAWAASWTGAALARDNGWIEPGVAGVVIALSALLGLGMLLSYRRFLSQADELRRKIELDALALAFGVGLVAGMTYWLLEEVGVVADAELVYVLLGMVAAHSLGIFAGYRRYA